MKTYSIRIPSQADLPAMKTIIDANAMFPSDMLDDMIEPFLTQTDCAEFWRVVESEDSAVVGLAYCAPERMTEGTWNLLLIAVQPDWQNQRLGKALMQEAEREVTRRNAHLLLVETSGLPEYQATRGFYAQIGYRQQATITDYYCPGDDKVVFSKHVR